MSVGIESLFTGCSFEIEGHPRFGTISRVCKALGVGLVVVPTRCATPIAVTAIDGRHILG